ncbi:MAG: hypothetical protein OIF48_06575 [Silicimonas sp.]|nr:hypothetical protein [Silicimonas sp.]
MEVTKDNLMRAMAVSIHAENVEAGWWDDWPDKTKRLRTARALVMTEIAEAVEGLRKDLMDDHLPHHKMLHVEIADAMIRALDMAGAMMSVNAWKRITAFEKFHRINFLAVSMTKDDDTPVEVLDEALEILYDRSLRWQQRIGQFCATLWAMSIWLDFDLWGIIEEKRAYNRQRADHKREARAALGGKSF